VDIKKSKLLEIHNENVGAISVVLSKNLGFNDEHIDEMQRGGNLHDIGKSLIPDSIISKPEI